MLSEHSDVKQDYSLLPHHVHDGIVDYDEYFENDDVSSSSQCWYHCCCCVQGRYGAFVENVHGHHVTVNNVGHGVGHDVRHDGIENAFDTDGYLEIDHLGYDHLG